MKSSLLLLGLVLLGYASASVLHGVQVTNFAPSSAGTGGKNTVTVSGVGFRTYSQASCVWGARWASSVTRIVSDSVITCDTPLIPHGDLVKGLPMTTSLDVVFDGDQLGRELVISVTDDFVFGPTITEFEPANGFVGGGNTLTIAGTGFSDFINATVMLDTTQCITTTIVSDTSITCVVPPGQFNQNAMVNIYFEANPIFYLHALDTYHYGPVFTTIDPPCGSISGGSVVTLTGDNLDDPIIAASALPTGAPIVQVVLDGTIYTAPAATYTGSAIVFTTPNIPNASGEDVSISVFFKQVGSKVSVASPFRYGPLVYTTSNPTPMVGHTGGGDTVTIAGCGFSLFNRSQIAPTVTTPNGPAQFCIRGSGAGNFDDTLRVVPGISLAQDLIVCFTNQIPCTSSGSLQQSLQVQFNAAGLTVTEPPTPLAYTAGPSIQTSSLSPQRATYTGLVTVTIRGTNLFQNAFSSPANPGWRVDVLFSGSVNFTALGTVVSDTEISLQTPTTLWGLATTITFNFIAINNDEVLCPNFPRSGSLPFFFGPVCSGLTPSNGWLSGNQPVQVNGAGFTESNQITLVRMCNARLNSEGGCAVSDVISSTQISDTSVLFTTPSIRQGITTTVGGNRLFGDTARVLLTFDVPSADLAPSATGILDCGNYRFGPVVNSVSPNKGPVGPRGANSPGTPVSVSGSAFNDPLYNRQLEFQFGSIAGFGASVFNNDASLTDSLATGFTLWGGQARSNVDLTVVFNTCNTTFSSFVINWGPRIAYPGLALDGRTPLSANNANLDMWGALPFQSQTLTITGHGFSEYVSTSDQQSFDGRCIIGGVEVATTYVDDNTVECATPLLDFATNATVALQFGSVCNGGRNYRQVIVARQRLLYTPRLDSFSPVFGLTSGDQAVTVVGEGFVGWQDYYCFFGQYTNGVSASVSDGGTTVSCTTPSHRGGFNTDVLVTIELYDPQQTFDFHMRVQSTQTYHYGPICTGVNPISGYLMGGYVVTLVGQGFQDCSVSDTAPFRNCIFETYNVSFRDPITGERVFGEPINNNTQNSPNSATSLEVRVPNGTCMYEPIVEINFADAIVLYTEQHFVQCKNDAADFIFRYGPVFTSITGDHVRNNIAYGWIDDEITINGVGFLDPAFTTVMCLFNNTAAETLGLTDTQIVCRVPPNEWDALVNITLEFTGANSEDSCEGPTALAAGQFHYGPVIDSLSPLRGYVQGDVTLTVSGFAFDCCGINQWRVMLPAGDNADTQRSGDSVTCAAPFAPNAGFVLVNIGVRFSGTFFNGTNTFQTLTEAGRALVYYYGPIITGVSPSTTALSGLGSAITINGVGFADPFFTQTLCDFVSVTGGANTFGQVPTNIEDTQIVCPPALYSHECGAVDTLSPSWTTILGQTYVFSTQRRPVPNNRRLPYFVSAGTPTRQFFGPIRYGASVVDVEVNSGPGPEGSPDGSLSAWTSGGLQVTIVADNLQDWISDDDENSFGPGTAQCLFGNRRTSVTSISESNSVSCVVPRGDFDFSGTVALLLNPNFDSQTTLMTTGTDYWHWLPFADTFSRPWGRLSGFESFAINGGGFCEYNTVVCLFGGVEAVESDITNDFTVTCRSPPSAVGADTSVVLQFCNSGECETLGSVDQTTVVQPFIYAGVRTLAPNSGPTCGGTSVTVRGSGFQFFESLFCEFAGKTTPATRIDNNTLICNTPNVDVRFARDLLRCSSASVVAILRTGGQVTMRSPVTFLYGVPMPLSVTPSTALITHSTQVTVVGEFFNGGGNPGDFLCRWGNYPPQPAQNIVRLPDGLFQLTCNTPSLSNTPNLTVGEVDFQISFDCPTSSRFKGFNLKFNFTQNPFIDTFTPTAGPEFGGTNVTVSGYFAGGSRFFCSFGQVLVSATRIDDSTLWCISPANKASTGTLVPFLVSIDGGNTVVPADEPYIYQNVKCAAGALSPAMLLAALVVLLSVLLF